MTEGLTVIAAGLLVVLCIMLSMFVFVEVILKVDQVFRARAERGSVASDAARAEPAPPVQAEASRKGGEVIAAIGLALHSHLARGAHRSTPAGAGSVPSAWASSGRLEIMAERQRVTSHRG